MKRKVTSNSLFKPWEKIIYADNCGRLTSATNRGFIRYAAKRRFLMRKVTIHTVKLTRRKSHSLV